MSCIMFSSRSWHSFTHFSNHGNSHLIPVDAQRFSDVRQDALAREESLRRAESPENRDTEDWRRLHGLHLKAVFDARFVLASTPSAERAAKR